MKKFILFVIILVGIGTYFAYDYIEDSKEENRDRFYAVVTEFEGDIMKVTAVDKDDTVIIIDGRRSTMSIVGDNVVYNPDFTGDYILNISKSTDFTWQDATMNRKEVTKGSVVEVVCKKESMEGNTVVQVYGIELLGE